MFKNFFLILGHRFRAGGNYNARNTYRGARITNHQGIQLMAAVNELHSDRHTTAEPTYWPTHENRRPDLLDFFISYGIARERFYVKSCLDLTSDHSAVYRIISSTIILKESPLRLHNARTEWDNFSLIMEEEINLKIPLKTEEELDNAVEYFTNTIQSAAWQCTPQEKTKREY
jgi:hypothetical protein